MEGLKEVPFMMRRLKKARRGEELFGNLQCKVLGNFVRERRISRVAFVDDNPLERALFKGKLREMVPCKIINDPLDWSDKGCQLEDPEVTMVMIDLVMPDIDGFLIARRMRTLYPDALLVALTSTRPENIDEIFSLFDGFLLKPLTSKNLSTIFTGDDSKLPS